MPTARNASDRWVFLRDLLVFQGKLALDGLRDLVLSPVSLVVGLLDLLLGGDPPGRRFYRLLRAGRRSEGWIDLFGAAARPGATDLAVRVAPQSFDGIVSRLERIVLEQYQSGGMTASAKQAIDRWLDALERRRSS